MQSAILFAVTIVGTMVFLLLRPAGTSSRVARMRDRRGGFGVPDPFHAVSIQPAPESCPAAESLKLQRFLSEEAPSLPLANCATPNCSCKYIHHADRRGGARTRRSGTSAKSGEAEFWSLRDRRALSGRRYKDRKAA